MTKALELAKFGRETPPTGVVVGDSDTQTLSSKTFSDGPVFSSGTVNAVGYLNASKVFSTSGTFVFDGTNLGVGVASPGYMLHVKGGALAATSADGTVTSTFNYNTIGTITSTPFNIVSNNSTRISIAPTTTTLYGTIYIENTNALNELTFTGSEYTNLVSNSTSAFDIGTNAAGPVLLTTNSVERMRITSAGNVGIGNTDPDGFSGRLTVGGTIAATSGNYLRVWDSTNTTYVQMNVPSTRSIRWTNDAAAEYMRIDSVGSLGVGVSNPSSYGKFVAYSSGGYGAITTNGHLDSVQLLDVVTAGGRFTGSSSVGILGSIGIEQTTTGSTGGYILFRTCASGTVTQTERMRITSTGNVGIGTDTPAYKVHAVKTGGGILGRFDNADGITDVYGYGLEITRSDAYIKSSGVLHLGSSHGYSAVYIDTSGRVSIGTTDTATFGRKLLVNGTGGFNNDSGTVGIGFNKGSANTYGYIGTGDWAVNYLSAADFGISSGATGALAFGTGAGTERMRIASGGNVGIGTNDPQDKFHVAGGITSNTSGTGVLNLGQTGGGATYVAASLVATASTLYAPVGKLSFRLPTHGASTDYGLTEQMLIEGTGADSRGAYKMAMLPHGGNVGIGTSSPAQKLHVSGTSASNSSINALVSNGVYQVTLAVMGSSYNYAGAYVNEGWLYTDSSNLCIGPYGNYAVKFLAGGEERARITAAGSVGIGTSSPNTKFEVAATTMTGAEISAYTTNTSGGNSSKFSFWRNYTVGGSSPFRAAYISNINTDDSFNGNNTQHLGFYTKSGTAEPTEKMRIQSNGNVAIGFNEANSSFKLGVKATANNIAAFESQASSYPSSAPYNAVIGRGTNIIAPSTTTTIARGYGGGIALIVMRANTGVADTQYTYLVTWAWNSATVLFVNTYGSNATTSTFTASASDLQVNHNHSGACYFAVTVLMNGEA